MNVNTPGIPGTNPAQWFQDSRIMIPGYYETLYWPLYDRQAVLATAVARQTFFTQGATGTRNYNDTNLRLNSQLSKGQAFKITGLEVDYYPDLDPTIAGAEAGVLALNEYANDMLDFYSSGWLQLQLNGTEYLIQGNLLQFAPQRHVEIMAAYATTAAATTMNTSYATAKGKPFNIVDKLIESNTEFNVTLNDVAARSTTGVCYVRLNGFLGRNAQG